MTTRHIMRQGKIEELANEILSLEDEIEKIEDEMTTKGNKLQDKVGHIAEQLTKAAEELDDIKRPYIERAQENREIIQHAEELILEEMIKEPDKKTIDFDIAKVQMKTTKSVKVLDKKALVDALTNMKGGIEKGVKTFALPYIRKLMEVDEELLEDIAAFDEKHSIYVKRIQAKGD